jgi:uncharacterized protein YciU (UPF0263 family)
MGSDPTLEDESAYHKETEKDDLDKETANDDIFARALVVRDQDSRPCHATDHQCLALF